MRAAGAAARLLADLEVVGGEKRRRRQEERLRQADAEDGVPLFANRETEFRRGTRGAVQY